MRTANLLFQAAAVAVFVVFSLDARADLDPLASKVLIVMHKWPEASKTVPHVPYEDVAADIAAVVAEEGPIGGPASTPERSGILLAGLGYFEGSRFAAYVDDNSCNDWMAQAMAHPIRRPDSKTGIVTLFPNYSVLPAGARKLIAYGDCDGGKAWSLWQVWPKGDFTPEKLRVRKEAARAALLIARASFKLRGNLSAYTGEPADIHPKADERERFAARFY